MREFDPLTDWPLRPYTAYENNLGELIWITDSTPALGIRDGVQEPLENVMNTTGANVHILMVTGLNLDWSTRTTKTCNGWSSASASQTAATGDRRSLTEYIDGGYDRPYDEISWSVSQAPGFPPVPVYTRVYCIEQ